MKKPRLPKVGDKFGWHGGVYRVSETSLRHSSVCPVGFVNLTLYLDRVEVARRIKTRRLPRGAGKRRI